MGDKSIYYLSIVFGFKDGEIYDLKDFICFYVDVLDKSIYFCCLDWSMDMEIDEDELEFNKWKIIVENYYVMYEFDFWNCKVEEILWR